MNETPVHITELVYHTNKLVDKVKKGLEHSNMLYHYNLIRFHEIISYTTHQAPDATDFAKAFAISQVLTYLHISFTKRQHIRKEESPWPLIDFFLTESLFQLKNNKNLALDKKLCIFLELSKAMQAVIVSAELKNSILEISQSFTTETKLSAEENVLQIIPLYEEYITSFFPDLNGAARHFNIPTESIAFVVQPSVRLFIHHPRTSIGIPYPDIGTCIQHFIDEGDRVHSPGGRGLYFN